MASAQVNSLSGSPAALAETAFLHGVGRRVRELRARRGVTRKLLAREAAVSERFLGLLEAGAGNPSLTLLRRVAVALEVALEDVLDTDADGGVERRLARRFLAGLPAHRLEELLVRLTRDTEPERTARRARVAVIGLRGAGKSTLGERLARETGQPFIELDREIEREVGLPLSELFSLYGQAGYRRFERRGLERAIEAYPQAVLSVGGGIVAEPATFELLLKHCFTVWVRATPEEHMQRVMAQGDLRPMAGAEEAMADLKRILAAREPLYAKADATVDTSGATVDESLAKLRAAVAR